MTKVLIKSDKITLSGGIFSIIDHFNRNMTSIIDKTLGLFGYQYSEIICSLMSVYFCTGKMDKDKKT
jgi:hypothetical protein